MSGFNTPQPAPFTWAQPYNPAGSMGFSPGGMGGVLAPVMTQYLQQYAGPTNFLPHQTPAQSVMDQLAMSQYFSSTQANVFAASRHGTPAAGDTVAGLMSMFTGQPLTDLNRQQAGQAASLLNHPHIKPFIGALVGPERYEAMMFGQRGDPSLLAGAANRIGYYRPDPATGSRRMGAQSLQDFSQGLYSTLYEPAGNLEELSTQARSSDAAIRASATTKLKQAAKAEHETVISDEDIATRITEQLGDEQVGQIYRKYQPGGKAKTKAEQAKEIIKFDSALRDTGVLATDETSVGSLRRRAEQAAVESMHGFMAGQAGQVAEHLFQRGMLPQSIGALSPAERVKVLSQETLDDETKTRLAKEMGRRDLLENKKDTEFTEAVRSGNTAKQEEILAKNLDNYKGRIDSSLKQIKDRQATGGPIGADEAERLLSADGMGAVAANIDAKRSGQVIKKHTEALAAVREIFGDNGNPNAPVPALMAALDALSQGASSRTNSGKVASTLREMRTMAKEMGMSYDQMLGMSNAIGAYGDQLGLYGETKMGAQANAMAMLGGMNRAGAFADQRFGGLSKEDATQRAAVLATRSEGSVVAKGSAAIRRAYAENKDKYKGTELAVIAEKMSDPSWDGSYEFGGQKRNFFNEAGQGGMREFNRIAEASNMTSSQMRTLMRDSMTQEYALDGAALKAGKADFIKRVSARATAGQVSAAAGKAPGSRLNEDTEKAGKSRRAIASRLTEMIIDSAHMSGEEQLKHLDKTVKDEFVKTLVTQGYSQKEAEEEADTLVKNMLGDNEADRRAKLQETVARQNRAIERRTGGEMRNSYQAQQMFKGTENLSSEKARVAEEAEQAKRIGASYQGTPLMRGADYLARIGRSGEAFNLDEFLKSTFNIKSHEEIRNRIAPELQSTFGATQRLRGEASIDRGYLNKLGDDKLKEIATRDMTEKQKEEYDKKFATKVDDKTLAERRVQKLQGLKEEELKALYKKHGSGVETTKEKMISELASGQLGAGTSVEGYRTEDMLDSKKGEYTREQQINDALRTQGGAERGFTKEEREKNKQIQEMVAAAEKGLIYDGDDSKLKTGLKARLQLDALKGGYTKKIDTQQLITLGADRTDEGKAKLNKYLADSGLGKEQQEQIRQSVATYYDVARKARLGDSLPAGSPDPRAGAGPGTDPKATAAPGTTPAPAPGAPTAPGTTSPPTAQAGTDPQAPASTGPAAWGAAPAGPGGSAGPAADKPAQAGDKDTLAANVGRLADAIGKLEQPFNDLIAALDQGEQTGGKETSKSGADPEKAIARDERRQQNQEMRQGQRVAQVAQQGSRGGSRGGESATIKGTLTLVNLQSAVLSARGGPIFTPPDGGPSVMAGEPAPGPYLGSAAVPPGTEVG